MNIEFRIASLGLSIDDYYYLEIDGKRQLDKIPKGQLRTIFYEMEKFARLRFKGELKHK